MSLLCHRRGAHGAGLRTARPRQYAARPSLVGDASSPIGGRALAIHRSERHRVGNRGGARGSRLSVSRRIRIRSARAGCGSRRRASLRGSGSPRRPGSHTCRGSADRPDLCVWFGDGPHYQVARSAPPALEPSRPGVIPISRHGSHRGHSTRGLLPPGAPSQNRDERRRPAAAQFPPGSGSDRTRTRPRPRTPRSGHAPHGGTPKAFCLDPLRAACAGRDCLAPRDVRGRLLG